MRGSPQSVPELGLQRVRWVRILADQAGTHCTVAGIAHRRPVARSIPLRTATALLAAGVPGWVTRVRTPGTAAAHAAVGSVR